MYMLISNTSTLVLLVKISCLEKFADISPTIAIPNQVMEEVLFDKESYYARFIQKLIQINKIKVINANEKKIKEIIESFRLDKGEAAAYALFDNKKYDAILTDDGELIKLCKLEKIPFICAMAVIIVLFEKKILSKEKALDKLKDLNEIGRYSKDLYEYFKSEVK